MAKKMVARTWTTNPVANAVDLSQFLAWLSDTSPEGLKERESAYRVFGSVPEEVKDFREVKQLFIEVVMGEYLRDTLMPRAQKDAVHDEELLEGEDAAVQSVVRTRSVLGREPFKELLGSLGLVKEAGVFDSLDADDAAFMNGMCNAFADHAEAGSKVLFDKKYAVDSVLEHGLMQWLCSPAAYELLEGAEGKMTAAEAKEKYNLLAPIAMKLGSMSKAARYEEGARTTFYFAAVFSDDLRGIHGTQRQVAAESLDEMMRMWRSNPDDGKMDKVDVIWDMAKAASAIYASPVEENGKVVFKGLKTSKNGVAQGLVDGGGVCSDVAITLHATSKLSLEGQRGQTYRAVYMGVEHSLPEGLIGIESVGIVPGILPVHEVFDESGLFNRNEILNGKSSNLLNCFQEDLSHEEVEIVNFAQPVAEWIRCVRSYSADDEARHIRYLVVGSFGSNLIGTMVGDADRLVSTGTSSDFKEALGVAIGGYVKRLSDVLAKGEWSSLSLTHTSDANNVNLAFYKAILDISDAIIEMTDTRDGLHDVVRPCTAIMGDFLNSVSKSKINKGGSAMQNWPASQVKLLGQLSNSDAKVSPESLLSFGVPDLAKPSMPLKIKDDFTVLTQADRLMRAKDLCDKKTNSSAAKNGGCWSNSGGDIAKSFARNCNSLSWKIFEHLAVKTNFNPKRWFSGAYAPSKCDDETLKKRILMAYAEVNCKSFSQNKNEASKILKSKKK